MRTALRFFSTRPEALLRSRRHLRARSHFMTRTRIAYLCRECGAAAPKWQGQCPACGAWNAFETSIPKESSRRAPAAPAARLDALRPLSAQRLSTGIGELDRVLGGGLVEVSARQISGQRYRVLPVLEGVLIEYAMPRQRLSRHGHKEEREESQRETAIANPGGRTTHAIARACTGLMRDAWRMPIRRARTNVFRRRPPAG